MMKGKILVVLITLMIASLLAYSEKTDEIRQYLEILENEHPGSILYDKAEKALSEAAKEKSDAVMDLLVEALFSSKSPNVREIAALHLGHFTCFSEKDIRTKRRAEKIFKALTEALKREKHVRVRAQIAQSLGSLGIPAAIPILKRLIANAEKERNNAIKFHSRDKHIINACQADSGVDAVMFGAVRGLKWMSELRREYTAEIASFLIEETKKRLKCFDEGRPGDLGFIEDEISGLLQALGGIPDRRVLGVIIEASRSKNKEFRFASTMALESFAFIDRYPGDESEYNGISGAYRVREEDRRRAEIRLLELTRDESQFIRERAEHALNAIRITDASWKNSRE